MAGNIDDVLAAINATPDANTGDPVQDAFTWEDTTPTPELDHPAANVPTPLEAAPQTQKASVAGPKVARETKGITAHGKAAARGLFDDADARIASQSTELAKQSQGEMDQNRADMGSVGDSIQGAIDRTAEFQARENDLQQRIIDFNQTAAATEQHAQAHAFAETQGYVANYKQQLAVVRQLAAQSGNPYSQMSQGEAIGLAGAQFAQGFLAAQGVNIDVAGQVDRWVNRSIEEHQMKVANARASAEDQMHLYEIARQNSQDEYEARQRYRGFVIAGLQAAVHLNATRFQSDIAMARGQEQIARLQVEADTTERSIADKHFDRLMQVHNAEYTRAFHMGSLAIEQEKNAIAWGKLAWEKSDKNPANHPKGGSDKPEYWTVTDPEAITGPDGKPQYVGRWAVRYDDKDAMEKARDARGYTEAVFKQLDNLERARKKAYDAYGSAPKSQLWASVDSPEIREYERQRRATIMTIRQATTGKAFTKEETKEYESMLPDESAWQKGNNETAIQQAKENLRTNFEAKMNTYSAEGGGQTASPKTAALTEASLYGKAPTPGTADNLEAQALAKDEDKTARGYNAISGAWADYKNLDPKAAKGAKLSDDAQKYLSEQGQSNGQVAVELLASAVVAPRALYKTAANYGTDVQNSQETPLDIRLNAYARLSDLAMGNSPDGGAVPSDLMDWAQYLKSRMDADPKISAALKQAEELKRRGDAGEGASENASASDVANDSVEDISDSPFAKMLGDRPGK